MDSGKVRRLEGMNPPFGVTRRSGWSCSKSSGGFAGYRRLARYRSRGSDRCDRAGGCSPEGCRFVFGSGRRVLTARTHVARLVDADHGDESCLGRGVSAVGAESCDGPVRRRTLWLGTVENGERGCLPDSASQTAKLSPSRFSASKWWTHPSALGGRVARSSNGAVSGLCARDPSGLRGSPRRAGAKSTPLISSSPDAV